MRPSTDRLARWLVLIAALWLGAVAITAAAAILGPNDGAAVYRLWQDVPWAVDVCGDFTWFARSVPTMLALVGTGLAFVATGSRRSRLALTAFGVLLATALAFAAFQNAIPWGEQGCIVD